MSLKKQKKNNNIKRNTFLLLPWLHSESNFHGNFLKNNDSSIISQIKDFEAKIEFIYFFKDGITKSNYVWLDYITKVIGAEE